MTQIKAILLIAALALSIHSDAQNYIYKGTQQYSSTSTWSFPTNGTSWGGDIKITVAKTNTGGYMMLSTEVSFQEKSISGIVTLILQNGKLITLTQRIVNDHVDGASKVLYVISSANYTLLKEHDIEKIRFSIVNSMTKDKESFTASNSRSKESIFESDKYNTANEIAVLSD